MKRLAFLLLSVAMLAGCPRRTPTSTPPAPPTPVQPRVIVAPADAKTVCDGAGITPAGEYNIQNDEWGSSAKLCLDTWNLGYRVSTSEIDQGTQPGPGAFPSIYQGCAWGGSPNSCTSSNVLPVTVGSISEISLDWQWAESTEPTFSDTGLDVWFNSTTAHDRQPDGSELGVTFAHSEGWTPAGVVIGKVNLGGASYTVWGQMHISGPGNYIVYAADKQVQDVSNFNLNEIFQDAIARGYVDPAWYLQSVQAGTEIWKGGVGAGTSQFALRVTTK